MSARGMFEELGYKYSWDDGFDEYMKAECVPDRINTEYIKFKTIHFNRLGQEVSIHNYRKNADCTEFLENGSSMKMNFLNAQEVRAINKQIEELRWK